MSEPKDNGISAQELLILTAGLATDEKEKKSIIRMNAEEDPRYNPYCGRCVRLVRMRNVEPFYWRCAKCGAEHDERR